MKLKTITYDDFLNIKISPSRLQQRAETIIKSFQPNQKTSTRFAPVLFLLDYSTKKYIYVDEGCFDLLGYTANYFKEAGVEEYLSKWHSADFHIINTKVFVENISFLKTIGLENYEEYIFSYNYRMKNANGSYTTVLQRFAYIPGTEAGRPAGVIGVIFDISHFKNDTSIIHTIEKSIAHKNGRTNELIFKKVHPVYEMETKQLLSTRELQILNMLAHGCSNKQIADKTNLSINTINNHRKNMLAKLQCKSSSELTGYAIRHGLV